MNEYNSLKIKNLTVSYGKREIIHQIDITASSGECIAFAGSNGCGKTTILKAISGTKRTAGAEMCWNDKKLSMRQIQRLSSNLPQETALIEELTVKDNLLLWYSKDKMKDSLQNGFLNKIGLQDILNEKVGKLSGGMKRKLAFSCAMAEKKKVIILDEPCNSMDLECKILVIDYLRDLLENGVIIILSSHDELELDLCSRLGIVKDGKLKWVDPKLRGKQLMKEF